MKRSLCLLIASFMLLSCRNDESSIPNSEVYVKTTVSEYTTLMSPNSCVVYPYDGVYPVNYRLGYGGIVIVRDMDRQVHAFDLACPQELLRTVVLTIKMPYATCGQCGSKFDLTYGLGNPVSGPAKSGMKEYKETFDRMNLEYILVTN